MSLEDLELGLEEGVEEGALACVLGPDDGAGKVVFVAVAERL